MPKVVQPEVLRGRLATSSGGGIEPPNGSVTTPKIADGAVTGPKIASGAVTGDKIGLRAVTADKMDVSTTYTVTDGDLTISLA